MTVKRRKRFPPVIDIFPNALRSGYIVQHMHDVLGWQPLATPFNTIEEARATRDYWKRILSPQHEVRIIKRGNPT